MLKTTLLPTPLVFDLGFEGHVVYVGYFIQLCTVPVFGIRPTVTKVETVIVEATLKSVIVEKYIACKRLLVSFKHLAN